MSGFASVVLVDPSLSHLGRSFTYAVPDGSHVVRGSLVRVPFHGKRRNAIVLARMDAPDVARTLPIHSVIGPGLPEDLVDLALWTADRYCASEGEALAAALPQRVVSEEGAERAPESPIAPSRPWPLGSCRNGAALARAVERGEGGGFVWRPRTDEPRGEAVATLVAMTLERGTSALVLVPEVRFESEVATALAESFGDLVAWLGSDRPARARYRDWLALRSGAKRVALGGRGAVFAPMQRLGLVVVDDEGHASYKEGRAPRFHARTVAAERARRSGATLVLTGVPPSIDARAAVQRGPYVAVVPDRSAERASRPPVSVVDLSKEDTRLVPSARTLSMARAELDAGRKVMVLAHRSENADAIAERVERILRPKRPVRLDARAPAASLERAARSADVVIATPFIAKDLPVQAAGLLAIVEADAALAQPEFRAHEETFATWWRASRWAVGGRLVIETTDPSQSPIVALTRWDPDVIWRAEAARRRELGYPPFAALARIDTPGERAGDVIDALKAAPGVEALGPVERDGRTVVVARASRRETLLGALRPLAAAWRADEEPMRIDVDPWEVFVPKWRS